MHRAGSEGVFARLFRALRLDPALYREVAASSGSAWQAVAVMCISAVASGLAFGAYWLVYLVRQYTVGMELGVAVAQSAVPTAGSSAIAHLAAWPVWALGLWIIGMRWAPAERPSPWFGQVARALAFAQAPAVVGALYVLLIVIVGFAWGPEGLRSGVLWVTEFWLFVLIEVWVLAGTFLAVRKATELSNGRTLAALVTVGLANAAVFGLIVVLLSGIVGRDFVGLKDTYDLGFRDDGTSALDIAKGLDFNVRFVGQSRTVLQILSESVLHPFAD